MTKQESVQTYKEYIDKHIEYVNKAFNIYGEELCERLNVDIKRLKWCIEHHDSSKYSQEEFEPYRKNFYKNDDDIESEEEIQNEFDNAWQHHLSVNSHHPEFWVHESTNNVQVAPMDPVSIAEMLLDWAAIGLAHGEKNPAYNYWVEGEGKQKPLHPNTVLVIEDVIDTFKEKEEP